MLNYIWSIMILFSFLVAFVNGRIDEVAKAAFDGAGSAVHMSISLVGIMCLWTGLMKIGEKSGLIDFFAWLVAPFMRVLFPRIKKGSGSYNAIIASVVANLFGMSNAATPLGLKAMKELHKINNGNRVASDEMCMFILINTASLQIVPSTIIAMRQISGSSNPSIITVPIWIVSLLTLIVATFLAKILSRRYLL